MSWSRETSPDPITLPSSPIVAHSARKTRSSTKPTPRLSHLRSGTPSRSIILDTPKTGNESPWRIKVAVEAEPRDGSPGKRTTRTTSVALNDNQKPSSPTKRASAKKGDGEVKRPARRRKGTPARDTRSAQPQDDPAPLTTDDEVFQRPARKRKGTPLNDLRPARPQPEPEPATEEDDVDAVPQLQRSHSPARRASGRLAQLSTQPGSPRVKRLSYARDELDQALQDAVGYSDVGMRCDAPGDVTTSKNEDFSMVSMESLQIAKENSLSNVMQSIAEVDKSAASVSYLPSSPPKVQYPNIDGKAEKARSSLGTLIMNKYDIMSWKPTGLAQKLFSPLTGQKTTPQGQTSAIDHDKAGEFANSLIDRRSESTSKHRDGHHDHERQSQQGQESVSQHMQNATAGNAAIVDDLQYDAQQDNQEDVQHEGEQMDAEAGPEEGADEYWELDVAAVDQNEDIWQDEASRSLEQDQEAHRSRQDRVDSSRHSPQLADLFAGQPLKPPRSKIPRTWRRSSGMDFSYVDSPAHALAEEPEGDHEDVPQAQQEGRLHEGRFQEGRNSTDGSGVLTPPSTSDSDQSENAEDLEGMDDDESAFEPDAEATRVHNIVDDDEVDTPGSEDSASSGDGEDTGHFFQTNLPQVYQSDRRRRRPPRQKTMDLTELLNLDGSPAKTAQPASSFGDRPTTNRQAPSSTARGGEDRAVGAQDIPGARARPKLISSPLRKSLLRSSKITGSPVKLNGQRMAQTQWTFQTKQRQETTRVESLQNEATEHGDSFESKASDQRQLLSEAAIEMSPQRRHDGYGETNVKDDSQRLQKSYEHDYRSDVFQDPKDEGHMRESYAEGEEDFGDDENTYLELEEEEDEYTTNGETTQPSRSYEERLNLESPQKIRVNFNDSSKTTSLSSNRNTYPSLFDLPDAPPNPQVTAHQSSDHTDSSGAIKLVDKKPVRGPSGPGFLTRLSTTFWNAVTGTPDPALVPPGPDECTALFAPNLRAQIRRRYGVVSCEFPWTFAQMRTLHRMLNSLTSNRVDSIIPRSGPLPLYLENLIDSHPRSVTGQEYLFTAAHAYVVLSFSQVMVSPLFIEAIRLGEVEPLGDDLAKMMKQTWGNYHGDEIVFREEVHGKRATDWVSLHRGRVGMDFVVSVLGTCVQHNASLEQKWGLPFEELQKRNLIGSRGGI